MDTYTYMMELEHYMLAGAVSIAFNAPERVERLEPGYGEIDVDEVHPLLRPVRKISGG